jgi:hypothetical protein
MDTRCPCASAGLPHASATAKAKVLLCTELRIAGFTAEAKALSKCFMEWAILLWKTQTPTEKTATMALFPISGLEVGISSITRPDLGRRM